MYGTVSHPWYLVSTIALYLLLYLLQFTFGLGRVDKDVKEFGITVVHLCP